MATYLLQYFHRKFTDRNPRQPITVSGNMTSSLAIGINAALSLSLRALPIP